ncbi:hypothetical protein QQ045_003042 [Rhodiola kirilowii]
MASQLGRTGTSERDIEQAITSLKKGAYLLKYGKRGKPKFCPFRLSNDESVLTWFSGKEEKYLKLSNVSRIISGQRTQIFQRHPRPEKEYQSFSLISNDGSLDVICKDKQEAEVWFSGLKALIPRSHIRNCGSDTRSDDISSETTSPRRYTQPSSPLHPISDGAGSLQKDPEDQFYLRIALEIPSNNSLDKAFSDVPPKSLFPSDSVSGSTHSASSGGSDGMNGHSKATGVDTFRVSLSSAMSSSSQSSVHDDGRSLGDVYIWGESFWDDFKAEYLLPHALESAVALDVHSVACGDRYAALVTKQGEIFSWGEESGGRLGHGVDSDILQPKLIDSLNKTNIEVVACGEYHTCAVSLSGDLYSWGDGTYNYGLLGHGNQVSQWVPKRVTGPLDGVHVSYISCGPWHTAVVTSSGQLFTFGDGTFGVLGHGDRISVHQPRVVESLKGLRTVRAACGVWHTAAVVEVMAGNSGSCDSSSGKLFTWGDGDKGRLGHGDKEPKLVPTCVSSLVDTNFRQVACGHSLTVALSNGGQLYTMGSSVYGQLGNPQAIGVHPTRVEGSLSKEYIEEIACGSYHVAVLTSRTEVYTWGKGANGRLGHGDTDDRNSPTLVDALKDKQVKSISCGTNFTAAICLHKRISCFDQSICSGCRSPFNFKKKRHNCYHCGLFFCHACSDKKALKASMASNPKKPHRVCNNCFNKLRKSTESHASLHDPLSRQESMYRGTVKLHQKGKLDLTPHSGRDRFSSMEYVTLPEVKNSKRNNKVEFGNRHVSFSLAAGSQWGRLDLSKTSNSVFGISKNSFSASVPGSRVVSRTASPVSMLRSPPRSATPIPFRDGTLQNITENGANQINASPNEEIQILRAQVKNLNRQAQLREIELQKTTNELKEAIAFASEENLKCKAAKEVIKSLTAQLKEVAERLPLAKSSKSPDFLLDSTPRDGTLSGSVEGLSTQTARQEDSIASNNRLLYNSRISINGFHYSDHSKLNDSISAPTTKLGNNVKESETRRENEWIKEDEPGVYITLTTLSGGVQRLKRVRFSRKRYTEKQAEQWWAANHARVYEQYNILAADK